MGEIKSHAFSDLYKMSSGISTSAEQAGHGAPFLSFSTVFNHHFVPEALPDLMDASESEQRTYSVRSGDVFLTRTSETVDELGMSCVALQDYPRATYSGFLKRLRPKQEGATDPKFMAFYLRSPLFRKTMTNNAVMVLRASLNEQIFSYLNLLLPDIDTQASIGEFLHLLTAKIDLNNRINAELEALAKTIYDYWFVQFDFPDANGRPYQTSGGKMIWNDTLKREIPAGWEATAIGKSCNTILGGTPDTKNPEYWDNADIPWLSSGETAKFPIVSSEQLITSAGIRDSAARLLPAGTVVVSIVRYIRPSILCIPAATNQSVVGISQSEQFPTSYLYLAICREVPRWISLRTGAQQPHINKAAIDETLILKPAQEVVSSYCKISDPIFNRINIAANESHELTQLRDWLLPLLMNGQVRVA